MEGEPDRPDAPVPARWQFSLITLFVVVTLVALVAAAFAWDLDTGILTYMGSFLVFVTGCWVRSAYFTSDNKVPLALAFLPFVVLAAIITFAVTCSTTMVQGGFVDFPERTLPPTAESTRKEIWGLSIALPVGTLSALVVYFLSWPRKKS